MKVRDKIVASAALLWGSRTADSDAVAARS
jgi:hypothetical protein